MEDCALVFEETRSEVVGLCNQEAGAGGQGGVIAGLCEEMEPKLAFQQVEDAEACAQRVAMAELCEEMEPHLAFPQVEDAEACAQRMAMAELCEGMEPHLAFPRAEDAEACAQQVVMDALCEEMEPHLAFPQVEDAEACAGGVAITEQIEVMEFQVEDVKHEETVACDQGVGPGTPRPHLALDCEAVVTEREVYLTVEDCTRELTLSLTVNGEGDGDGDGVGDGAGDGGKNIAEIITLAEVFPQVEEIFTEQGLKSEPLEESIVVSEPSWDDVPDEPLQEPVQELVREPGEVEAPRFPKRQRPPPENVDVDDVVQTMRRILMDLRNVDDARLHPDDDAKVRSLLEYHPQAKEKAGCGIDYIKIKRHSTFKDVRCFWVVRTDGSETDFSYHKCLKEKVAKDHPSFVDRYDAVYRAPKRPRQA